MNDSHGHYSQELLAASSPMRCSQKCARSSVPSYVPMPASTMSTRRGWRFCASAEGIGDDNPFGQIRRMRSDTARRADRAAELHLRLPGLCAGRLAGLGGSTQTQRSPSIATSASMTRLPLVWSSRLRRTSREQFRRAPRQGLYPAGVPESARRARGHVHLLAYALRADGDAETCGSRNRGAAPLDRGEIAAIEEQMLAERHAVPRRATGTTSRWARRSTPSPRGRWG